MHFAAGYVHDTPADTEMLHKMIAEADKKMYAQKRAYAQWCDTKKRPPKIGGRFFALGV